MKRFALLLTAAFFLPLFALRPGDKVGDVQFKLKWIDCSPFKTGELSGEEKSVTPPLRVLVFFFTRSESSSRVIQILEQTRRQYRNQIIIGAITPDTEESTRNFRRRHPDVRVRIAVDSERKLTPLFMAGSMLYPMAFAYDRDGKILWSGEAVDLPEAVKNIFAKRNDVGRQRKIAELLDDMQQRMRTGEIRPLQNSADKIFKLDPANASALRMMMFIYENSGRSTEAWELLNKSLNASPATLRLYFTALEMIRRYPALQKELPRIAELFCKNASTPQEIIIFSETLLNNFSASTSVLEVVLKQLCGKQANNVFADLTVLENIHFHSVKARLRYLLGDLDGAIKIQQNALNLFKSARPGDPRSKQISDRLGFYMELKRLRSVKF